VTVVRNENADAYVRSPRPEIQLYLVHGTDPGLAHERAAILVRGLLGEQADPFRLARLDADSIARDPGRLADEARAVPMLGGQRVIWIDAQSRDLARAIEPFIGSPPEDCWLIVEAGSLKRDSRLRAAFDRAANAVSIECYPDDRRTLSALIDSEARDAGIEVAREARDYLLSLLGSDRLTTRGEITKLMLYAVGSRRIELADVEAIVANAAPSGLGELIDQSLLGQSAEVERLAARFFADGGDPGLLTARLVSQLTSLHNLQLEVAACNSVEAALQKQGSRLPQAARATLARQSARWTLSAVKKTLPAVQETSARVRGNARLGQSLATRALWALASASRQGAP
jgi:DNA polymerase III subunit delta